MPALARARQQSGVSLEEIVARTKISIRFLRAIEAEDYEQLPGGVFDVNYLKQYAEAVGLDADILLANYREKLRHSANDAAKPPEQERRSFLNRLFRVPA